MCPGSPEVDYEPDLNDTTVRFWCPELTQEGLKTREFNNVISELEQAFDIHADRGSMLGGVHAELTGDNVTECIGGARGLNERQLFASYQTQVDPRLNYEQALELSFAIAGKMQKMEKQRQDRRPG
jgi:3-deoxy-7-phosphoheptulonate synthase